MNNTINALLVEDIKVAQMIGAMMLKSLNFSVDVAGTGLEALTLITKKYYSIIFMDIGLPDQLDGFMVTEKIRNSENPNKNTQIVALTSHDEKQYVEKALRSGMNGFLSKPLTEEKIKSVLPNSQLNDN